ncbi:TlpA disulfide reductase family protein [Robertkochia solimangrovi]|uniref:TlpA disulfide reductase family protein n=1 Tax=Robertkochia solimangrovi TaxID=2213046 RepID=UPI00117E0DCB|nr:TlpA disulfide reductase family protein [Robertkochia solimangrovi]TRZ45031.1 hypothetical protein DMZ48_04525 [Robertkochia solimangrovi]
MKNGFKNLFIAAVCGMMTGCAGPREKTPENTFVLRAEIKNLNEPYLVYYEKNDLYPGGYRMDTLKVIDGKFEFRDSLDGVKDYRIFVKQATKYIDERASLPTIVNQIRFLGYPGAEITVRGEISDFVNAYPSDGGINDTYADLNRKIYPLLNEDVTMRMEHFKYSRANPDIEISYDSVDRRSEALNSKVFEIKKAFISDNLNTPAAVYTLLTAFNRKEFDLETTKDYYTSMNEEELKDLSFYKELGGRLDAIESTAVGSKAPSLMTKNVLEGEGFDLESLKGNYVLIDYWGTWCGPCMGEMPKIKEYVEKYADKNFVVLGVDSGDTEENWRSMIESRQLNWTHIRSTPEHDLLIPYNVNAFPTKFLIDPEGKILYNSKSADGKKVFDVIDEIFKG